MAGDRVLIVDDEEEITDLLQEMVDGLGYEASIARTGEEAIAAMATARPDVVLLDLKMPGMPGLDALGYFRQHHRRVPVIVITGFITPEAAHAARTAGAFDVVEKPFDLDLVKRLLAQALRRKHP
jgi:DNA-binding NtrC family response regulator